MEVFVLFTDNPSWAAALPGGPVTASAGRRFTFCLEAPEGQPGNAGAIRASSVILNAMVIALAWAIFREAELPEGGAVAATGFLVFWPQHTVINASGNSTTARSIGDRGSARR